MATKRKSKARARRKPARCSPAKQVAAIRNLLKREDWSGADMLQEINDIIRCR